MKKQITTISSSKIGNKFIGKVYANGKMVGRYSSTSTRTEFRTSIGQRPWVFDSIDEMCAYLATK